MTAPPAPDPDNPVMAIGGPPGKVAARTADWADNSELIADVARLGYIVGTVLDPTYGEGTFWKAWRPDFLVGTDLDPEKSGWILRPLDSSLSRLRCPKSVDFTDLPYLDLSFETVVFDPPYKFNGTPDPAEERYGTHKTTRWQDRLDLILSGVDECARVASRYLLVKCQDQVVSGRVVWQTDMVTDVANLAGFDKVDRFDFIGGRVQPSNRTKKCPTCAGTGTNQHTGIDCGPCDGSGRVPASQDHARRYSSTLLVFERP